MPKVFIIILHWNNLTDTLECLESLQKIDYPNYQVVVIDNGSEKKFKVLIRQPADKIKIIYNQENLGFAGGNNVGIKYALNEGADYVLLLNDDTITAPDFLNKLIEAAESDKKISLAGPKIYFYPAPFGDIKKFTQSAIPERCGVYENKARLRTATARQDRIWSAGGKLNWLYNKATLRGWNEIDKGQYDFPKIQKTFHLTGCCILIKKAALEKIGPITEDYFLYYEDTDWSLRARQAGYKCVFVPSAKIWHKISRSAAAESPAYIYYHVRNGLIFAQKFAPWHIKPFIHLDALWRIKKQIFKLLFMPQKRIWARAILLGIKDFYLGRRGEIKK
jgi:GT2 family glycosyltransferase